MDFLILNFYLCIVCLPVLLTLRLAQKWLMLSLASFFILALPEREREDRSRAHCTLRRLILLHSRGLVCLLCCDC